MTTKPSMSIGILGLQGDVREHALALNRLGADVVNVRRPAELDDVSALIIPGGESTTIDKLLRAFGLFEPLRSRLAGGMPALGSCAGMILLATDIVDGAHDQRSLGAIPMTVRRNAFGRQVDSAEAEVVWTPDGSIMTATFIRAPWVERHDQGVEVLATVARPEGAERIVAVRYEACIATAFHPEISGDDRVHRLLMDMVR